jgi:hypothetical protein
MIYRKYALMFTLIIVAFIPPNRLFAQGPPIFTDTPIMLGLSGRGLRTFGNIVSAENAKAYVQVFAIPYNLTPKWQVGVITPFVSKNPDALSERSGIGDMKVFTKYQIYQKDGKGKTLRSLIKLTETLPTGSTSEAPTLGTGTYQTAISLVNGFVTTKYGIYGEFGYNFTSENLPNSFIYNIAFVYPLLPQKYPPNQLNLSLEFNGNYLSDELGNNFFISPGIQYIAGKKILFETGIQIPLDLVAPEGSKTKHILRIGARILLF